MRKGIVLFVLMTALLPLGSCARGEDQTALELALDIRSELLGVQEFSTQARIQADYGRRVYDFVFDVRFDGTDTLLTLTAPEPAAGTTARLSGDSGVLEYDGVSVETGPLSPQGLTPITAVPALWEAALGGYIASCALEEDGTLFLHILQPDTPPGTGTEHLLWLDTQQRIPLRGEISVDGFRRIVCTFSSFTKE